MKPSKILLINILVTGAFSIGGVVRSALPLADSPRVLHNGGNRS